MQIPACPVTFPLGAASLVAFCRSVGGLLDHLSPPISSISLHSQNLDLPTPGRSIWGWTRLVSEAVFIVSLMLGISLVSDQGCLVMAFCHCDFLMAKVDFHSHINGNEYKGGRIRFFVQLNLRTKWDGDHPVVKMMAVGRIRVRKWAVDPVLGKMT